MKKTLTANISGTVFHIEEDAYETLQRYLGNIRSQFARGCPSRPLEQIIIEFLSHTDLYTCSQRERVG